MQIKLPHPQAIVGLRIKKNTLWVGKECVRYGEPLIDLLRIYESNNKLHSTLLMKVSQTQCSSLIVLKNTLVIATVDFYWISGVIPDLDLCAVHFLLKIHSISNQKEHHKA